MPLAPHWPIPRPWPQPWPGSTMRALSGNGVAAACAGTGGTTPINPHTSTPARQRRMVMCLSPPLEPSPTAQSAVKVYVRRETEGSLDPAGDTISQRLTIVNNALQVGHELHQCDLETGDVRASKASPAESVSRVHDQRCRRRDPLVVERVVIAEHEHAVRVAQRPPVGGHRVPGAATPRP